MSGDSGAIPGGGEPAIPGVARVPQDAPGSLGASREEPATPEGNSPAGAATPRHVLRFAARSDRGLVRATNQDSVFAGDRLLVIADGMGGHAAGDAASRLVVAAFAPLNDRPPAPDLISGLVSAAREGNDAIAEMVAQNPELDGMGTTLTALLFDGNRVALAHVGDSRAYLYRSDVLHQLTHDDTFVQTLVDDGRITEGEAHHHPQRNLLLRALNGTELDPAVAVREVRAGDRYLVCSDGLSGVVDAEPIAATLADPDPDRAADALIQRALLRGGPDNVTVIVADVIDTGTAPAPGPVTAPGIAADPDATGPIQQMTREMPRIPLPPIPEEPGAPADLVHDDEPGGDFDDADDDFEDADDDFEDGDDEAVEPGRDGPGGDDDFDDIDDIGDESRSAGGSGGGDGALGSGSTHEAGSTAGTTSGGGTVDTAFASGVIGGGNDGPDGPRRRAASAGRRAPDRRRARRRRATVPAATPESTGRRWRRRGALTVAIVALLAVAIAGSTLWVRSQYYVGAQGDTVAVFRGVNGSLLGWRFSSVQEDSCAGAAGCTPIHVTDLQPAARNQVLAGIQTTGLGDARSVMQRLSGELLPPCPKPGTTPGPTSPTTAVPSTAVPGTSGPESTVPSTTAPDTTALATSVSGASERGASTPGGATQTTGHTAASGQSPDGHAVVSRTAAPGAQLVTVEPDPTTLTVHVTVTPSPPGLVGGAVGHALQVAATTTRSPDPSVGATSTGSTTTIGSAVPTKAPTTGATTERPSTVTAATPTVTVTQTMTATPTVTGTPLAPAPAVPGVTCRIVP